MIYILKEKLDLPLHLEDYPVLIQKCIDKPIKNQHLGLVTAKELSKENNDKYYLYNYDISPDMSGKLKITYMGYVKNEQYHRDFEIVKLPDICVLHSTTK